MHFGVEDGHGGAVRGQDVPVGLLDPADQPGQEQRNQRSLTAAPSPRALNVYVGLDRAVRTEHVGGDLI